MPTIYVAAGCKIGFQGLSTAFQFLTTITFDDVLKKKHTAVSTTAPSNKE